MAHHRFTWDQEANDLYDSGYACLCGVTYNPSEVMEHIDEECERWSEKNEKEES
jgi:hypothetical protein